MITIFIAQIIVGLLLGFVTTIGFTFMFTTNKREINKGLFIMQMITVAIITVLFFNQPKNSIENNCKKREYNIIEGSASDYRINLDGDSINIITSSDESLMFHADSIDIDEFIIKDNL